MGRFTSQSGVSSARERCFACGEPVLDTTAKLRRILAAVYKAALWT